MTTHDLTLGAYMNHAGKETLRVVGVEHVQTDCFTTEDYPEHYVSLEARTAEGGRIVLDLTGPQAISLGLSLAAAGRRCK